MANPDRELMALVAAILDGDAEKTAATICVFPELTKACFQTGATRASAKPHFLTQIGRYVYAGDTALHIASAAYESKIAEHLIMAGANVRARNRFGYLPLHSAAAGRPGSRFWNPARQVATIRVLIKSGADPNSTDKRGVTPLHIAVRTRCSLAVQTLLECGADPEQKNKNGSDALLLATYSTGRGGSGSPEAKQEQQQIMQLLRQAGIRAPRAGRIH